jgi:hypothetical protein
MNRGPLTQDGIERWHDSASNNGESFASLDETRLAMVSVPGSKILAKVIKSKVLHLFNRNFCEISKKAPRKLSC